MAKNNRNKNAPRGTTNQFPIVNQPSSTATLGAKLMTSLEKANTLCQDTNKVLEIPVEQDFLKNLIGSIHDDHRKKFAHWIEKFAALCEHLNCYQQGLDKEHQAKKDKIEQENQYIEDKKQSLTLGLTQFSQDKKELENSTQQIREEEVRLAQKDSELLQKERDLNQQEINAKHGFANQNREALQAFAEQKKTLELNNAQLEDKIRLAEKKLANIDQERSEAETKRLASLDEREYQLNILERKITTRQTCLDRESKSLREEEDNLQTQLADAMDKERLVHQNEITRLDKKLKTAWEKVDNYRADLANYKEIASILGDTSPEEMLADLDLLKDENRSLRRKLERSNTAELESNNEELRTRVALLEKELNDIRPEVAHARQELAHKRVAATELQTIALEKRVLEQHKDVLSVQVDTLENRIEQLTNSQKTQTPFPAMTHMDNDKAFRASMELEEIPDLATFPKELQHRIAQSETVNLYYPIEDIRVLLAGLAMSQLHVFQGISGTGKTSLAKAFAKAMGGFCTDIAVQAGWRDRDDLLGHYNTFERRFYEKDCLQALYKAQTPRWQDTCNVILLDEMNLSRPEQYFSEFLSALEKNNPQERLINLSETALPNAPHLLKEGRQILVPANIWFIGTANHDETTNELADKTYDRAHVMTLPKQDSHFSINKHEPVSYSFSSLQKAFKQAEAQHSSQVKTIFSTLTKHPISQQLADTFELGWGNRFERQAQRFIPVMLACGASEGEALDHLLATRVMRNGKVTGRYDVCADDIEKLTMSLKNFWETNKLGNEPSKSLELLIADKKRKERGG